jgi:hypothetical protein
MNDGNGNDNEVDDNWIFFLMEKDDKKEKNI